ncbi:MAG: VWA domain-containing protein [Nitrospira sp.]
MALWSTKRRFIYGFSVVFVFVLVAGGIFGRILYHAPTCSDGFKNGDETGVDCGGGCINLCTSDALEPVVLWSKVFNISGDVYTAVAFVDNPNINSKNPKAKYKFRIFDDKNVLITVKEGETTIPKGKKFTVFETGLILKNTKPKFAEFQFTELASWEKDTSKEPEVSLEYSTLLSTTSAPRVIGTITNKSLENIPAIELDVLITDSKQNVIAASRTFVDNLIKKTSQDFVFTWQKPFNLGVDSCSFPLDVAIALDKSGSMKSEKISPPEPFTTVVSTAQSFIKNLSAEDQVSITSFGNSSALENALSLNKQTAITAVSNLRLSTTTLEQTNITAGLSSAFDELQSSRIRGDSKKVMILLTDGVPTLPTKAGVADNPAVSAQNIADNIKSKDIEIYTIGLGKGVSDTFLKSISTDDAHYLKAPDKETLTSIYGKIASSLCQRKPNVITVIYRSI